MNRVALLCSALAVALVACTPSAEFVKRSHNDPTLPDPETSPTVAIAISSSAAAGGLQAAPSSTKIGRASWWGRVLFSVVAG